MFVLKKIVSRLLFPLPLGLGLSLIGLALLWLSRRQKLGKIIVSLGVFLLLAFSSPSVGHVLISSLESRYPSYGAAQAPMPTSAPAYVVVLAGGTEWVEGYPLTRQIGGGGVMRLVEGVRLYRACADCKLVLSGGYGSRPDVDRRSLTNYRFARFMGVPDGDIIVENSSWDTEDEARNLQPIVGEAPFVLVTSGYHMPRALAIFRSRGMDPIAAPSDFQEGLVTLLTPESFYPNAGSLWRSELAIYEYLGMLWARIRGLV